MRNMRGTVDGSSEFLWFILVVALLFVLLVPFIITVWRPFARAREYIKMEIDRCGPKERAYWKRELKKLYLRQIPFIGKKLAKKCR